MKNDIAGRPLAACSSFTKLAAMKEQGARLGNPTNIAEAGKAGRRVLQDEADRFAANMLPIIRTIQSAGPIGMVSIAKQLSGTSRPSQIC
jgi:DNA transposition AAA+ family ATPase